MLFEGIDNVLHHYNRADIYISVIHADKEFKPIFADLEDKWEIDMNFSLSKEHAPDIKRANRTLQERFRVALYRLPFCLIPRVMIQRLALRVTRHALV